MPALSGNVRKEGDSQSSGLYNEGIQVLFLILSWASTHLYSPPSLQNEPAAMVLDERKMLGETELRDAVKSIPK